MLLTILVSIVVTAYIVESLLDRLNQSTARNPLDPKIAHLYDPIEREKSIAYSAEKTNFGFISSTFSTVIMILALALGWFAVLDELIRERFENEIVISLLFIAVLSVISWWLNLPFQLYSIFKIEAKYGFNKTTVATFISDAIKGSAIAVVLGGSLLSAVLWLYQELGSNFWIFAWALVSAFSLLMFMFGTSLILPLFNKLKKSIDATWAKTQGKGEVYQQDNDLQYSYLDATILDKNPDAKKTAEKIASDLGVKIVKAPATSLFGGLRLEIPKPATVPTPAVSETITKPKLGEAGGVLIPSREDFIQAGQNIYEKGMEFGAWAKQMIQQFGDVVREFLGDVWQAVSGAPAKLNELMGYLPGKGEAGAVTFGRGEKEPTKATEPEAPIEPEAETITEAMAQGLDIGKEDNIDTVWIERVIEYEEYVKFCKKRDDLYNQFDAIRQKIADL